MPIFNFRNPIEYPLGLLELLTSGATGAVGQLAGLPAGLLKSVESGKYGTQDGISEAEKEAQRVSSALTYLPRTETAREMASLLGKAVEASKLPPIIPEAQSLLAMSQMPKQAYVAQGMNIEKAAEPVVRQIMERGGLPAQLLGDFVRGSVSRVVPVDIAKRIDMPVNLPQSKEFLKAVENEPSAQITDQGLLMNLKRLQTPEQSMAESVRTGVFYLPEGQAANLKHYKGKTGYGGSEAIEGETLYKNPLFVKGATGGKAPEAAYDQLVGKGAYQEMRNDVLKSYVYNANQSQKVEAVKGLLEKYNGLDSDDAYNMAYNIVSNSKGGNTLPYAIQENIVAHKVRNAGHDAVLGYGKGRGDKGEFFSEVFDVREYAYPNAFGSYELMPEFAGKVSDKPVLGLLGQSKATFTYPQEEAMRLAQQRAALPVEQGGLGLAADNTAEQRAAIMFPYDVYHGTNADIEAINTAGKGKTSGAGAFVIDNPLSAETYVNAQGGANIIPMRMSKEGLLSVNAKGRNWADIDTNTLAPKAGKKRYSLDEMELDKNSATSTDELGIIAKDLLGLKGVEIKNVKDLGPNSHIFRAKEYLYDKYGIVPDETWSNVTGDQFAEARDYMDKIYKSQKGTVTAVQDADLLRSRFAAFDPFRRNAAIAAAMGVAAPDLLAKEIDYTLLPPKEKKKALELFYGLLGQ